MVDFTAVAGAAFTAAVAGAGAGIGNLRRALISPTSLKLAVRIIFDKSQTVWLFHLFMGDVFPMKTLS
jgi:hypothetical protein